MLEKISLGILTFIITFWIVIFIVLPIKSISSKQKFLLTCFLSLFITIMIMIAMNKGIAFLENIEWDF